MATDDSISLLFWNTFLLKPRPIPGGPGLPAFGELAAPAVAERATRIGEKLSGTFDIVAMAEAFEPDDCRRIVDAWSTGEPATAAGPGRSILRGPLGFASSGLFTVVDRLPITRRATHRFATRGSYLHDADALANKGVLLVEVDLPGSAGTLELCSTHLIYGTGLVPGRTASDPVRRHRLRMAQVDELVEFIIGEHRPGHHLVLAGDFNVPAHDPGYPDGPDAQYQDLVDHLAPLQVVDAWSEYGSGSGHTCGAPIDDFADQRDPERPDALVDHSDGVSVATSPDLLARRERIDYLFVALGGNLRVASIRRFAFPRAVTASARDRLVRLSDHLALGVDLIDSSS